MNHPRKKFSYEDIAKAWSELIDETDIEDVKNDPFLFKIALVDTTFPHCWACGYFAFSDNFEGYSASKVGKRLEMCHIMPHYFLEREETALDYVLMCRSCHDLSPDCKDVAIFKGWFVRQTSALKQSIDRLMDIEGIEIIENNFKQFIEFYESLQVLPKSSRHESNQHIKQYHVEVIKAFISQQKSS